MLMEYYNADMPGFSIPAAEHSTITSWTEAGESDGCENMLIQFPNGFVAVVSDSWNILRAVRSIWGDTLRNKVLERDGVVVIRPDSGDPKIMLPAILEILGERFGFTTNAKGYKVLDPHVRVIQGDGITRHSLAGILDAVMEKGWSADNLAFGSGGGLLQSCNRDTQRMAIKCSEAVIGGVARDVYKQPQSDITKSSKQGQLMLVRSETGELKTVRQGSVSMPDLLVPVFKNGQILVDQTLDEIRSRATSVY
jgi:nicotinamide phosphoribosyltransferase